MEQEFQHLQDRVDNLEEVKQYIRSHYSTTSSALKVSIRYTSDLIRYKMDRMDNPAYRQHETPASHARDLQILANLQQQHQADRNRLEYARTRLRQEMRLIRQELQNITLQVAIVDQAIIIKIGMGDNR